MKVRVLWVAPGERHLKIGCLYDLADGQEFIARGEAEAVDKKTKVEADPRPQPEVDPEAETTSDTVTGDAGAETTSGAEGADSVAGEG